MISDARARRLASALVLCACAPAAFAGDVPPASAPPAQDRPATAAPASRRPPPLVLIVPLGVPVLLPITLPSTVPHARAAARPGGGAPDPAETR